MNAMTRTILTIKPRIKLPSKHSVLQQLNNPKLDFTKGQGSMNWTARRQRFRQILAGNDCITPATVFDPLSARMVEDLGGQVGMLAGSVAAMSILGAPDKMLITASEFADMALRI